MNFKTNDMKKKQYIVPGIAEYVCHTSRLIMGSTLDPNQDQQEVTPDPKEEIDGGFGSRRNHNAWDEEEYDEEW